MEKKSLMGFLRQKDYAGFIKYMEDVRPEDISPKDEAAFFRKAPKIWLWSYLQVSSPLPAAERILMTARPLYFVELTCQIWGLYIENTVWAFEEGSDELCSVIIRCLRFVPSVEVEKAMLNRHNERLFRQWLDKFSSLSEEGERMLEEHTDLQTFKSVYIEHQSRF